MTPRQTATHRFNLPGSGQGIYPDSAPYAIPDGGMVKLDDMLADQPGKYRKRGGWKTLLGSDETAYAQTITGLFTEDAASTFAAFGRSASGGTTGTMYHLDKTTAVATSVGGFSNVEHSSRLTNHLGHAIVSFYPQTGSGQSGLMKTGGATGAKANITSLGVALTAGNAAAVISSASTANMEVGMYVSCVDDSVGTKRYVGRITEIIDGTHVTLDPIPTLSITSTTTNANVTNSIGNVVTNQVYGGKTVVSWQNRIVLGNVALVSSDSHSGHHPERVAFTILPTETVPSQANWTGLVQFYGPALTANNWFDVVGVEEITGLALMGEGELIVFGPRRAFRVTGTLETQNADSDEPSWQVGSIPSSVGCISADTIQQTPLGVVFASVDDVYVYDGSSMQPLMTGRCAREYRALVAAATFPVGSGIIRGHYFVSMKNGTSYLIDLNQQGAPITRLTNFGFFDTAIDPDAFGTAVSGLRYYNQGGVAPSMVKGQLVNLDPVFEPDNTNLTDADTTTVLPTWQTPVYAEGDETGQKRFNMVKVEHTSTIAIGGTLEAARGLNPSSWSTFGTFTTVGPQSFGDKVYQTEGISYRAVQVATSQAYDLEAVSHAFQPVDSLRSLVA